MTLKDIAAYYRREGIPFIEEDFGPRSDTGESAGPQHIESERHDGDQRTRPHDTVPDRTWWWEKHDIVWKHRTPSDQEWVEILDDFFAPYLAMLPRPKGNLVWQVYNNLSTYKEAGEAEGMSKQGAQQGTVRAIQELTRLIAEDDALFRPERDGRRRDFEEERRAARRVLAVYLSRRRPT